MCAGDARDRVSIDGGGRCLDRPAIGMSVAACRSLKIESLSMEMSTVCLSRVDRGSRCRSSVDRGSIEVLIASIDRHSILGVNSTHDLSQSALEQE